MVFAFLVNSVPGYAAEGIDSLPVAGTVSIDNSVPADPSSISEAAFDTDLPDSRSSAPESESTSVPADISNETKPDDVIDPASSTSRVEAETVTEPIEGSETGTDSETLLPAEIELKKIAPVDESPSETAARSADVGTSLLMSNTSPVKCSGNGCWESEKEIQLIPTCSDQTTAF